MNAKKFLTELKRRNVYKVAIPVVASLVDRAYDSLKSPNVLVRLDDVASRIVNTDHSTVSAAAVLGVSDCIIDFQLP